jgi:hypothetical protein
MGVSLRRGTRVSVERRGAVDDRRRTPRAGQPGRRACDIVRAGICAAVCMLMCSSPAFAQRVVNFGFDANSAQRARSLGMPVSYGSLWVGSWNQKEKYGWGGIKDQLATAKASGVTPVVQWWYWGDDISPTCVENGCKDKYQGVWKDKATWYRMSNELADLIVQVMGPASGTIVIVETEFNQRGIQNYEPFDGYLVDHMAIFHTRGIQTVVGFGNWDRGSWKNFDRAVAAGDMIGVQALLSSVRDSASYLSGADMLINAARYNQATFGKPSFVTDFGFSSYPEPSYELYQDTVVRDIFSRMDELRAAGVEGMIWRMLADDPKFDTNNYHGMAERFWGLIRADGSPKLAFKPFLNGMITEKELANRPPAAEPEPVPDPEAFISERR